jgi:chromosome segregation ATPase
MSLITSLRGTGIRRAIDKVAELRAENVALLTRQAAADDYFALLSQDRDDAINAWQQEKQRREQLEKDYAQLEAVVRDKDREIADLKRKVDIGVKAEHVIAKTQEIDVTDLRNRYTTGQVRTLHDAANDGLLSPVVQVSANGAKANPHRRPVSLTKAA